MRTQVGEPTCKDCGGLHFGSYKCPYIEILKDEMASEEQKTNAAEWIRLNLSANQQVVEDGGKQG